MTRLAWGLGAALAGGGVVLAFALVRDAPEPGSERPAGAVAHVPESERERRFADLLRVAARGADAASEVPRLSALLGDEDLFVRWLAADALGRIGPAAAEAEAALKAAHDATRDAAFRFVVEGALEKIGGWVRFAHELPEEITYAGEPYLRVVEEAARREWLQGEDVAVARRCWESTLEHRRRLETDRVFRFGQQTLALNAGSRPFAFEGVWSPPFLICASDGTAKESAFERVQARERRSRASLASLEARRGRFGALLATTSAVAQAVYAKLRRERGAEFDLRPLEAEYGGRPDYGRNVRSYSEGFPVELWVWSSPDAFVKGRKWRLTPTPGEILLVWPSHELPLQIVALGEEPGVDPEAAGFAACAALLHAWRRQANRWSHGSDDALWNPLWMGLCATHAGWTVDPAGGVEFTERPRLFVNALATVAKAARDLPGARHPWMPLREHLRVTSYADPSAWLERNGVKPALGRELHRAQSFGLVRWLETNESAAQRAALNAGLRELLRGERPDVAVGEALGVRTDRDWGPIESAFHAWLRAEAEKALADVDR